MERTYFNIASSTVLATAVAFVPLNSTPEELKEIPPLFGSRDPRFSSLDETRLTISRWLSSGVKDPPLSNPRLSTQWLLDNRMNFRSKWVVLIGDTLIGSGVDPKPLVEKARAMSKETPFVAFVEEKPVWGGLL